MKKPLTIETNLLTKAALEYRSINNKLRQKMLFTIHGKGAITVTRLYKALKIKQTTASLHLAILRRAGLVHAKREGQQISYRVNYKRIHLLHDQAEYLLRKSGKFQ